MKHNAASKNVLRICFFLFVSCSAKNAGTEETIPKLRPVPPIPESIAAILESEPQNYNYRNIKRQLETFPNGAYSVKFAAEQAIYSDNDTLVIEIINHYPDEIRLVHLCEAISKNVTIVRMLLDSGVNMTHDHGWNEVANIHETVLAHFAYHTDDPAVLQLLIDRGAKVNTEVYTPTGWSKKKYQFSSVFQAAQAGKAGNLQVLIENGGDIHRLGWWHDDTTLMMAAESGSDECVKLLLAAGAEAEITAVNEFGQTALMMAAESGNEKSVRLLLAHGAADTVNVQTSWGKTALMEAAIAGNPQSVKMLIEAGADVNAALTSSSHYANTGWYINDAPAHGSEGGQTAMMMASTPECVKLLLEAGADVNARDKAGRNALLFQCFFNRNSEIVSQLINAGSYLYLDKDKGRNLLYLASHGNWQFGENSDIIDMLYKAGCMDENPGDDYDSYDYYFLYDGH